VYAAKTKFVADNPNTVTAILRGHVAALRLARANRALAVQTCVDHLKYAENYASRAADEAIAGMDERGRIPERSMPTFWKISIANGDVKEIWPESKYLDRRWIDTFAKWAPHGMSS
jgi:ABC-type nitrate/sulfonate/bicarbonate transport system substrate-binding protein